MGISHDRGENLKQMREGPIRSHRSFFVEYESTRIHLTFSVSKEGDPVQTFERRGDVLLGFGLVAVLPWTKIRIVEERT